LHDLSRSSSTGAPFWRPGLARDRAREGDIPLVARAVGDDVGAQPGAEQREVADEVPRLVPDELVGESAAPR
jgi:hypothetical protein